MGKLFDRAKGFLPSPIKNALRKTPLRRFSDRGFDPYVKRKNVEGVSFDFWIGDVQGQDWYDLHCTDPDWPEMRFIKDRLIERGDVVFECGAHHGCTTILLASWVGNQGKVIAFEASPSNCEIIANNLKVNGIRNVVLERRAVGASRGQVFIKDASNASVSSSNLGTKVDVTDLDRYDYLQPTFLKLDVEGFEVEVLKGAHKILSRRPKLAIEVHPAFLPKYGSSVKDVFELIHLDDYEVWRQESLDVHKPWAQGGGHTEAWDPEKPITDRTHLFCLPRTIQERRTT